MKAYQYERRYDCRFRQHAGYTELIVEADDEVRNSASCQSVVHAANPMVYPAALKTIEAEAFSNLAIKECVLSDNVESIGEKAFADCSELLLIHLPDHVKISDNAFAGCDQLTILCSEGSTGHIYAAEHDIPYVIFEKSSVEKE